MNTTAEYVPEIQTDKELCLTPMTKTLCRPAARKSFKAHFRRLTAKALIVRRTAF